MWFLTWIKVHWLMGENAAKLNFHNDDFSQIIFKSFTLLFDLPLNNHSTFLSLFFAY